MPTLMDDYEETARPSDMAWFAREFDQGGDGDANDTTLSGSLLAAALDDFRRTQKTGSPSNLVSPPRKETDIDQSVSLLGSPELVPPRTPFVPALTPQAPQFTPGLASESKKSIVIVERSKEAIPPGPNQQEYEQNYKEFVSRTLDKTRNQYPGMIPDYAKLSPEKQRVEQERVLRLLERLELGGRHASDKDVDLSNTRLSKELGQSQRPSTAKKTSLSFATYESFFPEPNENDDPMDTSMGLLSPIPQKRASQNMTTPSGTSAPPIELSRAAARFSSPMAVMPTQEESSEFYRKRMATTSGKRGADASRRKRESDALVSMDMHSPQPKIFSSSQSPIISDEEERETNTRRFRRQNDDDGDESSSTTSVAANISFGGNIGDSSVDRSLDSIDESALVDRQPLESVANNVHLKTGAALHFRPLATKRYRKKPEALMQHFPDPLDSYNGKTFDKMKATYKWIRRRMAKNELPAGVVFSLTGQKIIDLCLKLTLNLVKESEDHSQSTSADLGQTLIVVRERESLEEWKRAFRERSSLGLLCHCELPLKERRSVSTAKKCASYGIVLTTFDALSAPDSTVTIGDDDKVAKIDPDQDRNGWLQGRGSSQSDASTNNCLRLSILHRLKWRQVIFIDALGRKSFMAKPGTSRNRAAAVLDASARLLFFEKDIDTPCGFAELVKSDKKALSGVAAVLHTDWERVGDGDYTGKSIMLDYDHALRIRTTSQKRIMDSAV